MKLSVLIWKYEIQILISVNRYSPAPISIKHLLEHGKTNDNLVREQLLLQKNFSLKELYGK